LYVWAYLSQHFRFFFSLFQLGIRKYLLTNISLSVEAFVSAVVGYTMTWPPRFTTQGEYKRNLHFQNDSEKKCNILRTSHLHRLL